MLSLDEVIKTRVNTAKPGYFEKTEIKIDGTYMEHLDLINYSSNNFKQPLTWQNSKITRNNFTTLNGYYLMDYLKKNI